MKRLTTFFCNAAVVALAGCAPPGQDAPAPPTVQTHAFSAHNGGDGCGDHVDDEDGLQARAAAAEPVIWKSGGKPGKHGTVAVRLLGINDFHGQLIEGRLVAGRPVGGAAVLATYLRNAMTGYEDRHLLIHAGDHVGASPPESALLQDEPAIQFLNLLANDKCKLPTRGLNPRCNVVGTLGNHEFDEGKGELLRLLGGGNHAKGPFLENPYTGAHFPYVSANVIQDGSGDPLIAPSVVLKPGKIRVGLIGAVLAETPSIVTPAGVAGLSFEDEAAAINDQVALLRSKGVRTIVVTIHQGGLQTNYLGPTDPGRPPVSGAIKAIVSQLDGDVDVVISGHTHQFSNTILPNAAGQPVLVTQAFSAGTAFAQLDLVVDRGTGDVLSKTAQVITTFGDVAPGSTRDPAVQALVDQARAMTAPLVNQVVANISADIPTTQDAAGESPMGDLIADAQRAAMSTDFAFMNPGGIRAPLNLAPNTATYPSDAPGLLLWGEVFTVQPFSNDVVRMDLTGAQVYTLLNQQWALLADGTERQRILQISGLTYSYDRTRARGDRILQVLKDGAPIDVAASYSAAVNSFLAGGGDDFFVLREGTNRVVGPVDLDALVDYMKAQPQPIAPIAPSRITKVN